MCNRYRETSAISIRYQSSGHTVSMLVNFLIHRVNFYYHRFEVEYSSKLPLCMTSHSLVTRSIQLCMVFCRYLTVAHNFLAEEEDLLPVAVWPRLSQLHIYDNPLTNDRVGDPPMLRKYLTDRLGMLNPCQCSSAWFSYLSIPT